jgi:hypothetical protein
MNIAEKYMAGNNIVVVTDDGVHHCFDYYRGGYYQLTENHFYYRIPTTPTDDDLIRAIGYCNGTPGIR